MTAPIVLPSLSELTYGGGLVMVGQVRDSKPTDDGDGPSRAWTASPQQLDGKNTQAVVIFVDDVDAHHAHAVAAGADVPMAPVTHDYGEEYWADRTYEAVDPEGHHWWFMQRVRG